MPVRHVVEVVLVAVGLGRVAGEDALVELDRRRLAGGAEALGLVVGRQDAAVLVADQTLADELALAALALRVVRERAAGLAGVHDLLAVAIAREDALDDLTDRGRAAIALGLGRGLGLRHVHLVWLERCWVFIQTIL